MQTMLHKSYSTDKQDLLTGTATKKQGLAHNSSDSFAGNENAIANSSSHSFSQIPLQSPVIIQPKLMINQPDDRYEKEADAMAAYIMLLNDPAMPQQQPFVPSSSGVNLQRKCAACKDEEEHKVMRKAQGNAGFEAPASLTSQLSASKGNGSSLPVTIKQSMGSAMSADFSAVRIHHDEQAAEMSTSIGAKAFTHGQDIYFNHSQYDPHTHEGKKLLAHELTHVCQQTKTQSPAPAIQRSFWGAVGGGLAGIAMGALTGFAMGGLAGGIIGGLLGGVIGAIAGDTETASERPLNGPEEAEARKVFGNSLDYGKVRVSFNAPLMAIGDFARTPYDTVYFPPSEAKHAASPDRRYYAFLIHELTHVWQNQHGVSVTTKLWTAMGGEKAYEYGGEPALLQAIANGKCFKDFNTEQQGDILRDYYVKQDSGANTSAYDPFVQMVQSGKGCP